jgi:hypothetical protein
MSIDEIVVVTWLQVSSHNGGHSQAQARMGASTKQPRFHGPPTKQAPDDGAMRLL